MRVQRINKTSTVPTKVNSTDAGWDLYADIRDSEDYTSACDPSQVPQLCIKAGDRALVSTGIKMAIPVGYYGRIADRSGNAFRAGLHVMAGVVDANFRGEIKVLLLNTDRNLDYCIKHGDRVAQIIIEKIYEGDLTEVLEGESLDQTTRGENGFGSSGK